MIYKPEIGWRLITPPSSSVISLGEAKLHLKVDTDTEDDYIQTLIDAATGWVAGRNRLLGDQVWELVLDAFPCEGIRLWKQPVQSVDSIQYVDTDGNTQTLDSDLYQVALASDPPRIMPAYGEVWPATRCQMESVTVRFTGGYNDSPIQIPAQIIAAMRMLMGHLYANKEAVVIMQGIVSLELPLGLEALLDSVIGYAKVY